MDTTMKVNNNSAVIYARYSSESQTEQSIEGQIRVITEYAQRNNIPIIDSYIDRAISGRRDDRPEFQRMIKDSKNRKFGYVLVYKFDRFSRDRLTSLMSKRELKKNGVKVTSVTEYITDDPQGILLESLIDGYSEYYSAELAQKVRRGNRESRIKGLYTGGHVIYGYKIIDKKYVIDDAEAEVVKHIFQEASRGKTIISICNELNSKGIKSRNGIFKTGALFKMIHNRKYTGIVETNGEVFDNIIPRIIDDDLFEKATHTMNSNHNRGAKYNAKVDYLLMGKVFCGYCGERLTAEGGKGKGGTISRYYKCSTIKRKRGQCECKTIRKELLEELVASKIKTAIFESKAMNKIADCICNAYNATVTEDQMLVLNEKSLAKNKKEINNIMSAIKNGFYNDLLKEELDKLQEEKKTLELENLKIKAKSKSKIGPEAALHFLDTLIDLNDDTEAKRKTLIERFVKKVIVYNDKIVLELYALGDISINDDNNSNNLGGRQANTPTSTHLGPPTSNEIRNI